MQEESGINKQSSHIDTKNNKTITCHVNINTIVKVYGEIEKRFQLN